MTQRDEAKLKQLDAKIDKINEDIKKLEKAKANFHSQKNTIIQGVYK